ncbi:MAG TPA: prenyltransferase/squalene oxidase repeat-containing protein [Thermoguttaceae bacterium]|nr:prenyltransferase/squalene oxidase repeat-containing protein [Thermoguttaceae bacterium]
MASKPSALNQTTATAIPIAKASAEAAGPATPKPVSQGTGSGTVNMVQGAKATGVREEMEEREELGSFGIWMRDALRQTPSWLVSMVFHMILLLGLALYNMPAAGNDDDRTIDASQEEEKVLEELDELEDEPLDDIDLDEDFESFESTMETAVMDVSSADELEVEQFTPELQDFGTLKALPSDFMNKKGSVSGSGLDGRGHGKGGLVRRYGGNDASEAAVQAALKWLAAHQMPDGGWSFAHQLAPSCKGQCRNPGKETEARFAATALALLPFLGAGQTHKEGKYKDTVQGGFYFLTRNMKFEPGKPGGSLFDKQGGRMYSHGLGAIAMCELFAMTHDKNYQLPAQAVIDFICYAQDPVGGGWRYQPREKGDTSVVGWQIMALKSGHMAYLQVPPVVIQKAYRYLDGVQANSGANYGYTSPGEGPATTAIGLLCRMYLGWKKDNPALQRGVKWLSAQGPSKTNMYFNYYATQVLRHWEGDEWKKWNDVMRDQLVESQAKQGHEQGSWYVSGSHGDRGGRLYNTAMATMILEVYYRHMPIYGAQSVEEEFPE